MTTIASVHGAAAPTPGASLPAAAGAPASTSLLPAPEEGALPADPISAMYYFESKDQKVGLDSGKAKVEGLSKQRHAALKEEEDAIKKATDAANDHSFWDSLGSTLGTVAKVAAVVGSIAVAVASCGAGTGIAVLAIAGCVLSTAAVADGEFHVLQKLGVDESTAGWIDTAMAVGGTVCSLGANAAASGGAAASEASEASSTAKTAGGTATVISGVSKVGQGAAHIGAAEAQADGDQALADAAKDKAQADQLQRRVLALLDDLKGDNEGSNERMGTMRDVKTIQSQTLLTASTWRV